MTGLCYWLISIIYKRPPFEKKSESLLIADSFIQSVSQSENVKKTSGATIIFTNLCKPEKTHYLFHHYGLVTRDGIQVRSAMFGK